MFIKRIYDKITNLFPFLFVLIMKNKPRLISTKKNKDFIANKLKSQEV